MFAYLHVVRRGGNFHLGEEGIWDLNIQRIDNSYACKETTKVIDASVFWMCNMAMASAYYTCMPLFPNTDGRVVLRGSGKARFDQDASLSIHVIDDENRTKKTRSWISLEETGIRESKSHLDPRVMRRGSVSEGMDYARSSKGRNIADQVHKMLKSRAEDQKSGPSIYIKGEFFSLRWGRSRGRSGVNRP